MSWVGMLKCSARAVVWRWSRCVAPFRLLVILTADFNNIEVDLGSLT